MSNFLDSILGGATEVYIAISPSNRLELGVLDLHTKLIKHYVLASIEYNESLREVADYEILKVKIQKLFEECGLQPAKCNVHLSVPTIWFSFKDNIPLTTDEESMKNIVLSELDQTYIFKRKDPVPFWFNAPAELETDTKSIFYTAIQADVMDTYREIFKEMGANLVEITCSLISDLKALATYGFAEEEMNNSEANWNLMIVNNSGFELFTLKGKKISQYYEEPLPVKSFEGEEIYSAINNAAQIALMSTLGESLVIISETDLVSAKELSKKLQFKGKVTIIEDNKFRKEPFSGITQALIPALQPEVSFHLLGMFPDSAIIPITINFLFAIEGFARNDIWEIQISADKTIVLTKSKAMLYSLIFLAIVGIPLIFGIVSTSMLVNKYQSQVEELDSELNNINAQLAKYNNKGPASFDPFQEIERVLKNNRTKIMAYAALGESVPKNLYLSYFMTGDDGYIDIQGCANTVEDVYVFFQNLKDSLVESKLRLSKLDLKTSSLDDVIENNSGFNNAPYVFEITNMDEGQLSAFMNALRGAAQPDNQQNGGAAPNSPAASNTPAAPPAAPPQNTTPTN